MMALDNNYLLFSQQPMHLPLLDWEPHSLSLGLALGDVHELNTPISLDTGSPMSLAASTGYLQDAVPPWSAEGCKRRRLPSSHCEAVFMNDDIQDLIQWHGLWDSTCCGDPLRNLNCLVEDNSNVSGGILENSSPPMPETSDNIKDSHSSRESLATLKALMTHRDTELEHDEEKKKKMMKKVVYPFAILKPVGLEGDVTLADINERILMRPTRPVKHPVGEFAVGPCVSSADGPGLSGKAVVGLTRIHTEGRGTITIIRTRG